MVGSKGRSRINSASKALMPRLNNWLHGLKRIEKEKAETKKIPLNISSQKNV